MKRRKLFRWFVLLAITVLVVAGWSAWPGVGAKPDGARLARMMRSPEWREDRFVNPGPMWNDNARIFKESFRKNPSDAPTVPIVVYDGAAAQYAQAPSSGLRITWFGHSSSLIEIDGVTVLTDPIWSARPSPVTWAGPARWYPPVLSLAQLPHLDAVLISHDHYDHLDRATIQSLYDRQVQFIVPLGVGAHLVAWGVPETRVTELDWWDSTRVGTLRIVATPARHASGRIDPRRDRTLWAGYAMLGAAHRAWYSGDTGMHDALTDIGTKYGPFDVTLIESGQYDAAWPDWHLGPEQAVEANRRVRGTAMIPVHWALFKLAHHGWTEPAERVLAAARCGDTVHVLVPQPGRAIEPMSGTSIPRWWPNEPWETAAQKPVVATLRGDPAARYAVPSC